MKNHLLFPDKKSKKDLFSIPKNLFDPAPESRHVLREGEELERGAVTIQEGRATSCSAHSRLSVSQLVLVTCKS